MEPPLGLKAMVMVSEARTRLCEDTLLSGARSGYRPGVLETGEGATLLDEHQGPTRGFGDPLPDHPFTRDGLRSAYPSRLP